MLIQPSTATPISPATRTQGPKLKFRCLARCWFGKRQIIFRKINNVRSCFKCFEYGGGKHFPHLPIASFFPVISTFFSLLFFHFLLPPRVKWLIFRPFYFINPFPLAPALVLFCGLALLLSLTFQNFTRCGKSHCDKKEKSKFCHLGVISLFKRFQKFQITKSLNLLSFKPRI